MAKQSKSEFRGQVKPGLKILKKAGLYTGKIQSGAPTPYQRSLVRKWTNVISGNAKVVSAPGASEKKRVALAREIAANTSGTTKRQGSKLIVSVPRRDTVVSVLRGKKTLRERYVDQDGKLVTTDLGKGGEKLPDLKDNQAYAIPFRRGYDGVAVETRFSKQEILALAIEYEAKGYIGAVGQIQVVYVGHEPPRYRALKNSAKKPAKKSAAKKRVRKSKPKSNVVQFRKR